MTLIDPGSKTSLAYVAAGLTTGAGAAAWSLSDVAAMFGIVASVVGIVCTIATTCAVIRSQRARTREQRDHHARQREIQKEGQRTGMDDGGSA